MHEEGFPGRVHARQPAAELAAVGVAREGVDPSHRCLDRNVPTVDAEVFGTVDE